MHRGSATREEFALKPLALACMLICGFILDFFFQAADIGPLSDAPLPENCADEQVCILSAPCARCVKCVYAHARVGVSGLPENLVHVRMW